MPQTDIFPGEVFANTDEFDTGIRELLPKYDELLETIVRCVPAESRAVLDLGCGTGELSLKLLRTYPHVRVVAVDYSPRMLAVAIAKMKKWGYGDRFSCLQADFGELAVSDSLPDAISQPFDACVSSLAIHHLEDEMKAKLFAWVGDRLPSGGCFWNGDPVEMESEHLAKVYTALRETRAKERGKTIEEVRAKIGNSVPQGYSGPDRLATVTAHLEMLDRAGFEAVCVPWKYFGTAIFGGIKT